MLRFVVVGLNRAHLVAFVFWLVLCQISQHSRPVSLCSPPSLSMAAPHPLFVLRGHREPIHALCFRPANNDKADAVAAGAGLSAAATSQVLARPAAASAVRTAPSLVHAGPSSSLLCSGDAQGVVRVWNLATRRSTLTIDAHPGAPVLALAPLGSHSLLSQGKEGTIKLWDLQSACTTPLRTIQTDSYTFLKMQLAPLADTPLLLVPCETASNLALIDLRLPPSENDGAVQLIECEKVIPRDPDVEESLMSRMDDKEAREMQEFAHRPRQYERKVGIVMAAKFFQPDAEATKEEEKHATQSASSAAASSAAIAAAASPAASASSSSSSASSSSSSLPSLHVAWASEAGIVGVWDIRGARQLFQHTLHKDPILSFDLNWTGQRGVTVSAAKDVVQFKIDCNKVRMAALHRVRKRGSEERVCQTDAARCMLTDLAVCSVFPQLRVTELGRLSVPHDGLAEVVLRDDDRLFATAGWDHRVRLFSCADMSPLAVLKEHTATVQCVAMTARNERGVQEGIIASGSKDGKVAVYQLYPEEEAVQGRLQSGSSASAQHAALFSSLHGGDGASSKLLS